MSFKNNCSQADVRVFKIRYFKFFKYVQFPVEYGYEFSKILTFGYKYTPVYMRKIKCYITKDHIDKLDHNTLLQSISLQSWTKHLETFSLFSTICLHH